jgi:hypothetical protein
MKPVDMDKFVEYLKFLGLICIRQTSSHHAFDYPDGHDTKLDRPVILRVHKDKQVPLLHMHTCLSTLNKTHKDFEEWFKLPKGKRKGK